MDGGPSFRQRPSSKVPLLLVACSILLMLALASSSVFAGATAKKVSSPSTTAQPAAKGVASTMGAAIADPGQGGKCKLDASRKNACGTGPTGSCRVLPGCPTMQWMGNTQYVTGRIPTPTGITAQSASLTNGLDPQGVLDMVNKVRAKVGSPPIVWDDRLACAAKAWVPLSNYDTCPHGAPPGFPFYAQVVGGAADPSLPPAAVAKNAIEVLFFDQEKPLADAAKASPNVEFVNANPGWKLLHFADIPDSRYGHYAIMCSSQVRACGFAYGLNRTGSGYTKSHRAVVPLICGHFA